MQSLFIWSYLYTFIQFDQQVVQFIPSVNGMTVSMMLLLLPLLNPFLSLMLSLELLLVPILSLKPILFLLPESNSPISFWHCVAPSNDRTQL